MATNFSEVFKLSETDTCSTVTHVDWPTRQYDTTCSQRALAVCQKCEQPLCAVHVEICPTCKGEFCEGCLFEHQGGPELVQ